MIDRIAECVRIQERLMSPTAKFKFNPSSGRSHEMLRCGGIVAGKLRIRAGSAGAED
jgi:hypothetical protein